MKAEQAHQMVTEATERLAEALKAGQSDQLRIWLSAIGRLHTYSVNNAILILLQCPGASHVAGFRRWQSLGRYVRKNEKGISIIAPIVIRNKGSKDGRQLQDDRLTNHNDSHLVAFRGATVFDVSQTEGKPLPEFARAKGDPGQYSQRLKDFVASQGITIEDSNQLGGAEGMCCGKRIILKSGLLLAEEFSVLVHELAHATMHQGNNTPASKTVRETEAEAVAFVVGQAVGLECSSSCDYIQLYDGKVDTLMESLERIQKTATAIIRAILEDPKLPARTDVEAGKQETMAAAA